VIGETLGNYRIESVIGEGGMGIVYAAEHTLIGRKVAVKVLRSEVSTEGVERFFTEARAAAKLHHPGLVEVFDFGHDTRGSAFIVMEFLEGESLAERIARDTRLATPIAAMITRQVAKALETAHNGGIVHRDLKPHNIFLVTDTEAPAGVRAKVLDFGIAKLLGDQTPRSVKTNSGAVIGTPRYMSPEQCRNARSVDGRADVYSLGCILYEMLVGVAPFDYDSWAELVGAHLHETPPRLSELSPGIPRDIERVVEKMLHKRPEDRYESMSSLASDLEAVYRAHAKETKALTPPTGVARLSAKTLDPTVDAGRDPTLRANEREVPTAPVAKVAPPRRRAPIIAVSLAVAAVGIGVTAYVLATRTSKPEGAPEPAYVVLDHRQPDGSSAAVPPPSAPADAAVAQVPEHAPADARTASPAADPDPIQRAFERQNGAIAACFRDQPTAVNEQIYVRVRVDTSGQVTQAEVLPEAIGKEPLGACLIRAARAVSLGPQRQAVTLRVPIRATVGR
jgi:serine/threonine-protein kinase